MRAKNKKADGEQTMNFLQLKYAVEVARCGSINKAADKLFVEAPNLSRTIKGLESSLGATLFDRSPKGMTPTADGEAFLRYAESILKQAEELEGLFGSALPRKKSFSISVPRVSYAAEAFAAFTKTLSDESDFEIFYKETNSLRAIKNILEENYRLGIIRYAENYTGYYKAMLAEKGLSGELITEFRYVPVVSVRSPLAAKKTVTFRDLAGHIEIAHADPYVPSLSMAEVRKEELPENVRKRIFVFERASQFELLSENPDTYMWVSPPPHEILERYRLTRLCCHENSRVYKDVLIRRENYKLSPLDERYIEELIKAKQRIFSEKSE